MLYFSLKTQYQSHPIVFHQKDQYMQRTDIAEIITGWIWITMNQQDARKRMDGAMGICFEIVPGELEM